MLNITHCNFKICFVIVKSDGRLCKGVSTVNR